MTWAKSFSSVLHISRPSNLIFRFYFKCMVKRLLNTSHTCSKALTATLATVDDSKKTQSFLFTHQSWVVSIGTNVSRGPSVAKRVWRFKGY